MAGKKRPGFTLIELIVVLVIMAVLAAAAIPRLMGYIDTSKATLCATNKAELLRMLKADEVARGQGKKLETDQLQALFAQLLTQEEDLRCTAGGTYTVSRGTDAAIVVNCSKHDDTYGFNMGQVIQDIGSAKPGTLPKVPVDSTAINTQNLPIVAQALKDMGFNMDAQGVKTWAYKPHADGKNNYVYWTTEAITLEDVKENNVVQLNNYNSAKKTYTAGYVRLVEKKEGGTPYPSITDSDGLADFYEYKKIKQTDETKASFDKTYAIFLKMTPAKTKTPGDP